jgi:acetyl-CoA acetyltransferase
MADGASAAIVCPQELAHKLSNKLPINVSACALRSGEVTGEDDGQRHTARDAFEMAALGPEDVEVVEVHDAMAPGEMYRVEKLGFCKAEEVGRLVDEGYFTLSGKLPVNTSGGLAARGHPIGATGLAQIAELVWQMRGEAGARQVRGRKGPYPKVGLAQNSGGYVEGSPAALTVTILKS